MDGETGSTTGTHELPTGPGVPVAVPGPEDALAALTGLDDRPLADHVAVLGRAHDELRRALDAPVS